MQVAHPHAMADEGIAPATVDVNGRSVPVEDGVFEIDAVAEGWLDRFAAAHDVDREDILLATDTCEVVKSDGDVCGRELPCQFHTDEAESTEEEDGNTEGAA